LTTASGSFWEVGEGFAVLTVRVTPKGGRAAIEGPRPTADGRQALALRVAVAPEKGAANRAVEQLLAGALGVPRTSVAVISGPTSRLKRVRVSGDAKNLAAAIAALGSEKV